MSALSTSAMEDRAVDDALEMACMVRDYGVDTIGRFLGSLDDDRRTAMIVALAALVPVDRSPGDLLAWVHALVPEPARRESRHPHVSPGMKRCGRCSEVRPLAAFYRDKSRWDGRSPQCVDCVQEARERRRADRAGAEPEALRLVVGGDSS